MSEPGGQQAGGVDARIGRRRRVAELVVARARGEVSDKEFREAVVPLVNSDDPQLAELVALVDRAPSKSWFFGVGRDTVRDDGDRIAELVAQFLGAHPGDPAPEVRTWQVPRD